MAQYEFLLHVWGEVMNEDLIERDLGIKGQDFWFSTKQEREEFKRRLYDFARERGAIIAFAEHEGLDVRKKTIAKIVFEYEDKEYCLDYDFGYGYPPDSAEYLFTDGNYECDCNRSTFLHKKYPDFPEMEECGERIKMVKFEVILV